MIIGSAEVVIRAITTGIDSEIKKALRDARGGVRDEGKAAGTEYSKGFSDSAGAGMERGIKDALKRSSKDAEDAGINAGIDYSSGFNDSTDSFLGDGIDDSLKRAGRNANVEGGTAGREYSQGFTDTSERDITASISRAFNSADASNSGSSVGAAFSRAFRRDIDRDSDTAGTSGGNAFTRAFSRVTDSFRIRGEKFLSGGFTESFQQAQSVFRSLYNSAATLGPVIAIAAGALSSLASGLALVALAGAQAAGSLAVLPGLISAAAQGGIVLAVATKGIGDAIKAGLTPAVDNAAKTGKAVSAAADTAALKARQVQTAQESLARAYEDAGRRSRDALQRVQAAEEDLGDAQREVTIAQLALNDARDAGAESLQQLGFSAEGAALAEQRAAFQLQDAVDDLAKVQDQPVGTRVRDEAELAFKEAELQYRESKDRAQDLAKEQEKAAEAGVDGTKEVIDAKNDVAEAEGRAVDAATRLRDAQEAQADAARQNARAIQDASNALADAQAAAAKATDDVASATDGATESVDKYAEAMKNLAPSQQAFVQAVVDSKQVWLEFKQSLGQNLFDGLDDSFRQITDLVTNDLQPGLAGTATVLNNLAKNFVAAFTAPENAKGLQNIIEGNNRILDVFNQKTSTGTSTIENLTTVFIRLGEAIQPVTEKFANWVAKTVAGWAEATDPAKGNGDKLVDFFNRAGNAAAGWGETFGNVFGAFKNVMAGAQGPINDFLIKMIASTQQLEDFTKTAADNGSIKSFFDSISVNAGAVLGFLKELGKAFVGIGKDPNIKRTFDILTDTVKESFGQFFEQLSRVGPYLARAFQAAIKLMNDIGENQGFVIFFKVLKAGIDVISWLIENIPGLSSVLAIGAVVGAATGAIALLWSGLTLVGKAFLAAPSQILGFTQSLVGMTSTATTAAAANASVAASVAAVGASAASANLAGAGGAAAGAASGFSKFTSFLGKAAGALPIVGIAAFGLSTILTAFGDDTEEVAKQQEEMANKTRDVQKTLNQENAAITENTRSWVLNELATSGALKNMQDLGIDSGTAIEGVVGVGDAAKTTTDQINSLRLETVRTAPGFDELKTKAQELGISQEDLEHTLLTGQGLDQLNSRLRTSAEAYLAAGDGAQQVNIQSSAVGDVLDSVNPKLNALNQVEGELAKSTKEVADAQAAQEVLARGAAIVAGDLAGAVGGTVDSYEDLIPTVDDATDSQSEWNRETDEASGVVDGVIAALDRLNGAVPSVDDTMEELQKTIDGALDGYDRLEDGSIDLSEAIIDEAGAIDLRNKNGREYRDTLKQQRDDTVAAAKAAFDAAGGINNLEAAQAASNKVTEDSLKAWEDTSAQLGISKEDADKYAAAMGLIPDAVTTTITAETNKAQIDLDKFVVDANGKVIGMKVEPGTDVAKEAVDKFVKDDHGNIFMPIDPNIPDAEKQLGAFVKNEDGRIIGYQVHATITEAKQAVDGLIRDVEGKPIGIAIDPKTVQAGADMDKFILDQEGKPIGLKVDPLSNDPTKIVDGWITDNTGKRVALAADPLGNNPTEILNGWVTTTNGTKYQLFADTGGTQATADVEAWVNGTNGTPVGGATTYNLIPNTNPTAATDAVNGWITGVNGSPGQYTYEVHPNTNSSNDPNSESNKQVQDWIFFNDKDNKHYALHPNGNASPDEISEASKQVNDWITYTDAEGKEYFVVPNTQSAQTLGSFASQQVVGWVNYINNSGQEVQVPVKATVQTQVAPPDAGALANVWNAYGLGNSGGFSIPWGTNATGGYIKGPGGPTDDKIYTRLSNGEYVIRASSVKRIGVRTLHMLNSGIVPDDFPRFASGGQVTRGLMSSMITKSSKRNQKYVVPNTDFVTIDGGTDPFISGAVTRAMMNWTDPFESWATVWNDGITANLNAAFGNIANWVKNQFSPVSDVNLADYNSSYNPSSFGWAQGTAANINSGYQWNGYSFPGGVARGTEGLWNALLNALVPAIPGGLKRGSLWGYENRNIDGTNTPSFHSYGLALDINADANGRGLPGYGRGGQYVIPGDVAHRLAQQFGMQWGGDWSYTDPMHFEIHLPPSAIGSAASGIARAISTVVNTLTGGGGETRNIDTIHPIQDFGAMNMSRSRPEWIGPIPPGGAVERWRPLYLKALQMEGQSLQYIDIMLNQMRTESSGDPTSYAIDSNYRAGHPSKSLLQVIPQTFSDNARPGYNLNIWDPLSNALASIRYVLRRYGSLPRGYRGVAYDTGGILDHMGAAFNLSGKPERILDPRQTVAFESLVNAITRSNGAGALVNSGGLSSRDVALIRTVAEQVSAQRGDTHVRVFIGQTELTDIIDTQVMGYDYGTARAVAIGRKP